MTTRRTSYLYCEHDYARLTYEYLVERSGPDGVLVAVHNPVYPGGYDALADAIDGAS